jgi:hypothetical protein
MFVVGCKISIGDFTFTRCNELVIEKSHNIVSDSAKIVVPTTAVLQSNDSKTAIETAKAMKTGMPVKIILAYKGIYEGEEFNGFVKRINYKTPLEIECEDAIYLLRKKTINKAWKSVTLKAVLNEIVSGTQIQVAENIHEMTLAPFSIKNKDGAWAIQELKDTYNLSVYMNSEGKLYAGLAYTDNTGEVKYNLSGEETNVINADDLKFRDKYDVKLKVKAIGIKGDNSRIEVSVGDDGGGSRTLFFYNVATKEELTQLAKQKLDKLKYDGYEGKLTTFLIPFAAPGMKATINDERYPERAGSYYVESTKTTWGVNGSKREVEISIKLL